MIISLTNILYKAILKPILFLFDPENVHDMFTKVGEYLGRNSLTKSVTSSVFSYSDKKLHVSLDGNTFKNPIGLSAGFDKDGRLPSILGDVGFGFAQVGSVTYNPYDGNPKPRLYRLKKSNALSVYYGLKNEGAKSIIKRLQRTKKNISIPLSISIAKTNADYTADDQAGIEDYVNCLREFVNAEIGEMYTINISCPNTFGGEPFTTPEKLDRLLNAIDTVQTDKPIYIKMPINVTFNEFKLLIDVVRTHRVNGLVISNLTKVRDPKLIKDKIPENVQGGISGLPTQALSDSLIFDTYAYCGDTLSIIGVGGVFTAEDAYRKIKNGASLVQLITGLVYGGPGTITKINQGLTTLLEEDGFKSISESVGANHR